MAERDKALVNILERLANEMTHQDKMLESLLAQQNELAKTVESAGMQLRTTRADSERSYDKLLESTSNYRSDMLSLVNEQDHINRNMEELQNILKITTYSIDVTNKRIADISERLSQHEKASSDHREYASKQPELLRNAFKDSTRDFTKLHMETEKNLTLLHKETERQLQSFQHETTRRLLLLDGILSSLETLLIRTEPPEKQPVWIARPFIKAYRYFSQLFKRMPLFLHEDKGE